MRRRTGLDPSPQQRNQIVEPFRRAHQQIEALLGPEHVNVIGLGLRDDLAHQHRNLGAGDVLLTLRDGDARRTLVAALEFLGERDRQLGLIETAVLTRTEKVLEFHRQFRVGPLARLERAAARRLDLELTRRQPRVRRQRPAQRFREIEGR